MIICSTHIWGWSRHHQYEMIRTPNFKLKWRLSHPYPITPSSWHEFGPWHMWHIPSFWSWIAQNSQQGASPESDTPRTPSWRHFPPSIWRSLCLSGGQDRLIGEEWWRMVKMWRWWPLGFMEDGTIVHGGFERNTCSWGTQPFTLSFGGCECVTWVPFWPSWSESLVPVIITGSVLNQWHRGDPRLGAPLGESNNPTGLTSFAQPVWRFLRTCGLGSFGQDMEGPIRGGSPVPSAWVPLWRRWGLLRACQEAAQKVKVAAQDAMVADPGCGKNPWPIWPWSPSKQK